MGKQKQGTLIMDPEPTAQPASKFMDPPPVVTISEDETIQAKPRAEIVPVRPTTPMEMLADALSRGMSPADLGKLMDLAERFEANRAKKLFNEAMKNAQEEMPIVVKEGYNSHTQKKYARLEDVQNAIKPIYTRHGFSLTFGADESKLDKHIGIYVDVKHEAGHTERHRGDFPLDDSGAKGGSNKTGIQATGSTYSYARRYLTLAVFNITVADEDNDGQGYSPPLNGEQIKAINDLIAEIEAAGKPFDFKKFLAYFEIETLDQIRQSRFVHVINELNRKRKAK